MSWPLEQWLQSGRAIRALYLEEMGRDILGDPEALSNWLHHMREGDHDIEWIRARFRESPEWLQKHPGVSPVVIPPVNSVPAPGGGGRMYRVTDEADGIIVPRMYSYWPNAYVNPPGTEAFVFAGRSGDVPQFFQVNLSSSVVTRLGQRVPYPGETEGWYWDRDGWVYLCEGPRLRRVNPFSGENQVVFDVSDSYPNHRITQAHSSEDGRSHSATLQNTDTWAKIGTVVFYNGQLISFPEVGELDESQVTADGNWVVIKETAGLLTNRIIELSTRITKTLTNAQGSVGHSDCGDGILVGEWSPQNGEAHGQCVFWDLRAWKRSELFPTWNMGYVALRGAACLHSGEEYLKMVALDGSGETILIAHHNVTPPPSPGYDPYDDRVKANISPCGRVACYMSNNGLAPKDGGRRDVYLVTMP